MSHSRFIPATPGPSPQGAGETGATRASSKFPVIELDEVDSTNLEALRRASAGERGPLWLIARRQTAGRGRSGRSWQSQSGNLAATLLSMPGCEPVHLTQLSLVTGVAVHEALAALHAKSGAPAARAPRLKWPNDVLAGEAKLAGILVESTIAGGEAVAAIGIGVNVATAPSIDGRATTAMALWGPAPAARELLDAIDASLRHWLEVWQKGAGFAAIRAAWLTRAGPLGEAISVNTGTEAICGAFAGIDETGALLVDTVGAKSNNLRRFTFGDVSLGVPPADEGNK